MDLTSFLVLILANIRYECLKSSNTINGFARATVTMNPIAVAQFFETIYIDIFDHLLTSGSNYGGFLRPVSTYFGIVERNSRAGKFFLHYFVWLCGAYYLTEIYDWLCLDTAYIGKMIRFINNIIWCSINFMLQEKLLTKEALSAFLDENNKEFALKLYQNSNFIAVGC